MFFAPPPREPGDVIGRQPPPAQVDEAAGQHGGDVAQMPAVPREVHHAAQPDSEWPSAQSFARGRIQRQVVLLEHLPGQAEVRRRLPERDRAVGWPERRLVGEALLDLPGDRAHLALAVSRVARRHVRLAGCRIVAQLHDFSVGEPSAELLVVVARSGSRVGVQRSCDLRPVGESLQQYELAPPDYLEAVEHHDGRRRAAGPHGAGSGQRDLRLVQPATALELGAVGRKDSAECGQAGGARFLGGFGQGDRISRLREQIVDGGAQDVGEPVGARDGFEIGGRSAFDLAPGRPREELAGQRARERLRIWSQLPAEPWRWSRLAAGARRRTGRRGGGETGRRGVRSARARPSRRRDRPRIERPDVRRPRRSCRFRARRR